MRGNAGQALVTFIFFIAIATTVTAGAVAVIYSTSSSVTANELRSAAVSTAEAGVDNALIRLLRDPDYAGETIVSNGVTNVVEITGTNLKIITSTATINNVTKQITVTAGYNDGVLDVLTREETN